ncbi:MAG: PH domain-containing protein [Tetrasphaera sp.]|nr:PH domain-containing protein [Tetrasphaera sp.]
MAVAERPGWIEFPLVAENSKELRRTLTAGERVFLNVPQHVLCLWKPALAVIFLTAVMISSVVHNQLPSGLLTLCWLAAVAWLVWSEFERRHNTFVATDQRILKIEGLINRRVPVMRRGKVTDLELKRSLLGRVFNYGTIVIESAGQDQALNRITFVRYPVATFRRLNAIEAKDMRQVREPAPGGATRAAWRAGAALRRATGRIRGDVPLQTSHEAGTSATHVRPARFDGSGRDTDEIPLSKPSRPGSGRGEPGIPTRKGKSDNRREQS